MKKYINDYAVILLISSSLVVMPLIASCAKGGNRIVCEEGGIGTGITLDATANDGIEEVVPGRTYILNYKSGKRTTITLAPERKWQRSCTITRTPPD